jgi:uncharacterized RDD family membrane protein YckC
MPGSDPGVSDRYLHEALMQPNPFAPPTVAYAPPRPYVVDDMYAQPLASRGSRLWATVLDGLVTFAVCLPPILLSAMSGYDEDVFSGIALIAMLVLWIYQWVLVSKTGQTLGKRWAGIRIVKANGSPVSFVSAVLVRSWAFSLITSLPWLGTIIGLADMVCIIGDERRCLHDYLAGTIVVRA